MGTIVGTFISVFSDHTGHIYIWFIHVDSVYASWNLIFEFLYYHTGYIDQIDWLKSVEICGEPVES